MIRDFSSYRFGWSINQCMFITYFQTIKAIYTTTMINNMIFTVYTCCFTLSSTQTTTITFILVNPDFK